MTIFFLKAFQMLKVEFEDEEDVMAVFNWFEEYYVLGKLLTNHVIGIRIPPSFHRLCGP